MLLAVWLSVEGVSLVAYRVIYHSFFSYAKALRQLTVSGSSSAAEITVSGPASVKTGNNFVEVLHPYFGFVGDPYQNKPAWQVSEFGFQLSGNVNPVVKRSPETVTVGLFGGSFSAVIHPSLKSILAQHASQAGKDLVLVNLAAGGYKQPQQLMILNYLFALGAEFDLIINLDGFNEIALPPEHIPNKVNPFFPRLWDRRTASVTSPATIKLIGEAEVARRGKEKLADRFRECRFYWSPALFMFWQARDKSLGRTLYERNRRVRDEGGRTQPHTYAMRGPAYAYTDDEQLYRDLVDVWKRSSLQMKVLSEANGARYYHFLQPNQYVDGSKPMDEAERSLAVNEISPYRAPVIQGYPLLQMAGHELQAAGVNFTDLTMIFSNNREVLYFDDCCHTNDDGSGIVSKRVYETVFSK